ncbi:uncharacterized protein FIBRA_01825 [Fibroporia radiculosa]|uniref:non-specific serine/threonine protein kinase n=1 Tax=Fibroporia radiculosa TaxID=599839 RepID=J4I8Q1_9APHY|nr:uncharacterized protein FIBRA_01825 [Fibroporia radiculosa]CCL99801.1 predicted protein [Fibroporia radiculosa]
MDSHSPHLHAPEPGPSRQATRPVSVQPTTSPASQAPSRKRASHTVVTSQPQQEEQPAYRDIYSHPAALEYAHAHPRRTIPKFGPYLLLRTLGEGEFGKVKLGLHMQWGEEVAVKLIRRGNIDTSVRMSKVEREIEVLRTLKHPNIVRLYDVIETEKYIGIILEYASGGELFDHILAHRYLREKDACKLFSQLISGVWYIHQKKIVHRDLKLENLLLDRHRNVIITDFGFANRFEHRADDLMQTSCGSPCYAAPELVISDGLYVGSAVDIWSCGVILYAMLAGYLPFDDDPANPDGDNINLLYKYIVNTPLSFPEYISAEARELLSIMLVPDPVHRADLSIIMAHPWLAPYAHVFTRSVADLERSAIEQHHQKRLAYQRQMKQQSANDPTASKIARSQSARTDGYVGDASVSSISRSRKDPQPEYLYETSVDQSVYSTSGAHSSSRRTATSTIVLPTPPSATTDDDPFGPSPSEEVPVTLMTSPDDSFTAANDDRDYDFKKQSILPSAGAPVKMSPETKRTKGGFRHTIQVEYGESDSRQTPHKGSNNITSTGPSVGPPNNVQEREYTPRKLHAEVTKVAEKTTPPPPVSTPRERSGTITAKLPAATSAPVVSIEVTGPPVSPVVSAEEKAPSSSEKTDSASSNKSRHRKGLSIDKIGISKLFGSTEQTHGTAQRTPSQSKKNSPGRTPSTDTITATGKVENGRRPSTLQVPLSPTSPSNATPTATSPSLLSPDGSVNGSKKSRRNTLTVMVEPLKNSIKARSKGRVVTAETPIKEKSSTLDPEKYAKPLPIVSIPPTVPHKSPAPQAVIPPQFVNTPRSGLAVPASTVKANRVMQWFRSKSKGKVTDDEAEKSSEIETVPRGTTPSLSDTPGSATPIASIPAPGHPQRSASSHTEASVSGPNLGARVRGKGQSGKSPRGYLDIRTHHGPLDQTMVTTGPPPEVMKHIRAVLEGMGVEISVEGEYKYRCVRPKRRKAGNGVGLGLRDTAGSGLAAFSIVGSAASNGVDKRGLPQPPQSHTSFGSTGGMLRGLLMRRQSSQVSNSSLNQGAASPTFEGDGSADALIAAAVPDGAGSDAPVAFESVYGDSTHDLGDEIRFSVELTRIDRLDGTYSLDIRRLKGNLRSYKFVYDTLRQRADLQRAV